jgi:hypothetical protein
LLVTHLGGIAHLQVSICHAEVKLVVGWFVLSNRGGGGFTRDCIQAETDVCISSKHRVHTVMLMGFVTVGREPAHNCTGRVVQPKGDDATVAPSDRYQSTTQDKAIHKAGCGFGVKCRTTVRQVQRRNLTKMVFDVIGIVVGIVIGIVIGIVTDLLLVDEYELV